VQNGERSDARGGIWRGVGVLGDAGSARDGAETEA